MMVNKLTQLKQYTVVVADTGDIEAIKQYHPQDATTNPSLLLKAASMDQYQYLIDEAVRWAKQHSHNIEQRKHAAIKKLMINFGSEILKIIPGRVSTEVDARLSFDAQATIDYAKELIDLYSKQGIERERVLIKVAATWEGIQAAEQLEKDGIYCNMTLIFNFAQAVKCADVGVTLISPFVGRIYDWYKLKEQSDFTPKNDPGVQSVKQIYNYYKYFEFGTTVMGASFRNKGQIEALSGCDCLTISPALLAELQNDNGELRRHLSPDVKQSTLERLNLDEKQFRWMMNEDPMATEKLADGIRIFTNDARTLADNLASRLG